MLMEIETDSNLFANETKMNSSSTKAGSIQVKDLKYEFSNLSPKKRFCSPRNHRKFSSIIKENDIISFNGSKKNSMFDFEINYEECVDSLQKPHCPHNTSQYLIKQYQNERKNSNEESEFEFQEVCLSGSILEKECDNKSSSIEEIAFDLDFEEDSNPNLSPMENYPQLKRISSKFRRKRINSCNS